jgi:hypothetical protein
MKKSLKTHELQLMIQPDENWNVYKKYCPFSTIAESNPQNVIEMSHA